MSHGQAHGLHGQAAARTAVESPAKSFASSVGMCGRADNLLTSLGGLHWLYAMICMQGAGTIHPFNKLVLGRIVSGMRPTACICQ